MRSKNTEVCRSSSGSRSRNISASFRSLAASYRLSSLRPAAANDKSELRRSWRLSVRRQYLSLASRSTALLAAASLTPRNAATSPTFWASVRSSSFRILSWESESCLPTISESSFCSITPLTAARNRCALPSSSFTSCCVLRLPIRFSLDVLRRNHGNEHATQGEIGVFGGATVPADIGLHHLRPRLGRRLGLRQGRSQLQARFLKPFGDHRQQSLQKRPAEIGVPVKRVVHAGNLENQRFDRIQRARLELFLAFEDGRPAKFIAPKESVDAHLAAAEIGLQCHPSGKQDVELRSVVALLEENVAFSEVNRRAQRHELVQMFGLELLEKGAPVQHHRFISHKSTSKTSAANIKYLTRNKVKHINIQFGCLFLQGRGPM